jgi:hypothetical protein
MALSHLGQKCKGETAFQRVVKKKSRKTDVSLVQHKTAFVKKIFNPSVFSSETTFERLKNRKKRQYLHPGGHFCKPDRKSSIYFASVPERTRSAPPGRSTTSIKNKVPWNSSTESSCGVSSEEPT